jgi:hypothetical protein
VAPASAIKSTSKACLAGTPDADRRIGDLAKYMTKIMTEAADPASDTQRACHRPDPAHDRSRSWRSALD